MRALLSSESARRNAAQAAVAAGAIVLVLSLVVTTRDNLVEQGIASGFGFLERSTGWDIPFSLIDYSVRDPYWRVLLAGFLNTIYVGLVSLLLATVFGTLVGIARISANPLLNLLGTTYVEVFRNVPLILQAFFWYALATRLPPPRRAIELGEMVYLSSRGVYVPGLNVSGAALALYVLAVLVTVALLVAVRSRARRRGHLVSGWWLAACGALVVSASTVALLVLGRDAGAPLVDVPVLEGLRFRGGIRVIPELGALVVSIVVFGSAYIAEIVRGGFNAVPRGQLESARALGLRPSTIMLQVHIPLALRAIVPPLGNQYVWLMKATTIGIAIGFSDLFGVVSTSINQSGQTIELLSLLMLGFFVINYTIASLMHLLDRAIAIKGHEAQTPGRGGRA